jgi:hypothetical protein
MKFEIQHVKYMPKTLQSGVLYVSREFETAAHLCACGCGLKVRTPLGPTEWALEETPPGPSLYPSIGNWQQPCQSHYWITRGEVIWAPKWSPEQIVAGRQAEQRMAHAYYEARNQVRVGSIRKFWRSLQQLFADLFG